MEKYQTYFGLAMIFPAINIGPAAFMLLETEALDIARVITIWESRLLNLFVSVGATYIIFIACIHVCLYVFLVIVAFLNSTGEWLRICW